MSTLHELLDQKKALDQKITALRLAERQDAIAKVRALMAEHGLTAIDLESGGSTKKSSTASGKRLRPNI